MDLCTECDRLIRIYVDAADRLSRAGEVLALFNLARNETEFKGLCADFENARQTLQLARQELINHISGHL
jgi:hypothetical protein